MEAITEPVIRVGKSLLPLIVPFLYPGYWLVRYVDTPRLDYLKHAIVGVFACHLVLLLGTPAVAYPDTSYVWEYAPGQSSFADEMYVQLVLAGVLLGVVIYGLWRANQLVLGAVTAALVLFTVGIPVSLWYWEVSVIEVALILLYLSRTADVLPFYDRSTGV